MFISAVLIIIAGFLPVITDAALVISRFISFISLRTLQQIRRDSITLLYYIYSLMQQPTFIATLIPKGKAGQKRNTTLDGKGMFATTCCRIYACFSWLLNFPFDWSSDE